MRITKATRIIRRYLSSGTACFLSGAPGVGKSDLAREISAADYDGNIIDFRATLRDPVDLRGLPMIDAKAKLTRWLVPEELPNVERHGKRGVLFLDEINAADRAMQAALFGLVLDRKLGDYHLPDEWVILAAGNRRSDKAAAQAMASALANRFAHVSIEPHVDEFVGWGNKNGIDPMVMAFLRFRETLIHMLPKSPDDLAFPTPRSWAQASKYVNDADEDRFALLEGCVGNGAATELEGFLRIYKNLPSIDLVLANPAGAPLVSDVSARTAITFALSRKVDAKNVGAAMTYVQRLPSREYEIMLMVEATRRDVGLSHTNAFSEWAARNTDVTLPTF